MLQRISSTLNRVANRKNLLLALCITFSGAAKADSVKVAFTGDQSVGENAQAVLQLIANEGADLLLIQGDLGYGSNAASQWEANLNNALGKDFPVLALVGNHENFEWPLYQSLTRQRIDRAGQLSCEGNVGVKSTCRFKNIDIVQVSPGINEVQGVLAEDGYGNYIRSAFSAPSNRWRICGWHKNMNALQTGSKGDSTGWDVYDACLDAGAMIAVAHEHAYSRSYLLSDFASQTVAHRNNDMTLESGKSFVVVSGLGGREVRPQKRGGDWWASIYTASQGATHGALFCEFDDAKAECYFKAVDGLVPDQFTLRRGAQNSADIEIANSNDPLNDLANTVVTESVQRAGYVFSRTDVDELRWIDNNPEGVLGSVWIDGTCAEQKGGAAVYGDWFDLQKAAPAMDSIADPCQVSGQAEGYVFSRTDAEEYRWIDRNESGELGSVWIDATCAANLGGPAASGDWAALNNAAPAFDSIPNPCLTSEFVFSRTDVEEFRWIGKDDSGRIGNVWIDAACAESLGGAFMQGNWAALNGISPHFDVIANPCQ